MERPAARITRGQPGAAFCNWTPLPWNLCPRTLLASIGPGSPLPAVPGRGPSRAHTAPRAGATAGARNPRRVRASGPAAAVLAPACRARQHPAHAAAVPADPRSLALKRVQTEVPSGLAASSAAAVGTATRKHIAAVQRIPGRQPAGLRRQRQRRIHHASAAYQQVSPSVTTSEEVTPVLLPVPAVRSRPLV
jgi:hypothetical protein